MRKCLEVRLWAMEYPEGELEDCSVEVLSDFFRK